MDPQRRQELEKRTNAFEQDHQDDHVESTTIEACNREWQTLSSWDSALRLNCLFLNGQRQSTVYHGGPVDPETPSLIPNLSGLHDYGVLTHNSQPFEASIPFNRSGGGWWTQTHSRPYLSFLLPQNDRIEPKVLERFCALLLSHPRIVTAIDRRGQSLQPRTNLLEQHIVTKGRDALSFRELAAEPYRIYTRLGSEEINEHLDWEVELLAQCLNTSIAARDWEDIDLSKVVRHVAMAAGMKPLYAESEVS